MNLRLEQLIVSVEPLKSFFEERIPIRISFKLRKAVKEIEEHLKDYQEARKTLLERYGNQIDADNYDIPEENREIVEKEHKDLVDSEVSISCEPLRIDDLGDIKMSSKDMCALDWLIE